MRKLMWFALGFAAACTAAAYGMYRLGLFLPCIGILTCLAVLLSIRKGVLFLKSAALILVGALAGTGWFLFFHSWYLQPVAVLDGTETRLEITAADYSYETNHGLGLDGVVTLAGKPYQIRVYLESMDPISPGDRVTGYFRLRLTTPGSWEDSAYFQGKGIFLLAYGTDQISVVPADQVPLRYYPALLRQRMELLQEELFPEDVSAFTKALLLGHTSELDYETDTALQVSGIRHIVAVSGLHVSVLYSLICLVTLRRRFLTAAVGIPGLLLFAAVAGFTPSVSRACIMMCLMLLSMVFEREYDPATAMSFAVLVMVMVNPLAVTAYSLQLSAGCVAGILLFQPAMDYWLKEKLPVKKGMMRKFWSVLTGGISVTLGAMSLVTPMTACYFGMVSLVSVVSNLLTLGLVNLIFQGLVLLCLMYLAVPGMAPVLAGILVWPVRLVLWIARTLASIPMAAVYTESIYIVFWLVFVYVLLGVFFLQQKKQPGQLLCCGILGLCLALLASWTEPMLDNTRITMLDVGQGQSILLQSEGRNFLVDCGGDDPEETADCIVQTLLSQGIHTLDGIILTHYDGDHTGALANLLTRVDTELLILPDTRSDFVLPETTAETVYVWEDIRVDLGAGSLQIYGPVYSGLDNENSLCILFDTEKCDILITGDRSEFGERMLLRRCQLPDVDILVAGHHGASSSTSEALLQAVRPETVLISVEQDNIYGHPSDALLQRLADYGCAVLRTDEQGTITIRR